MPDVQQNTDTALPGGMPSSPDAQPSATDVADDVFNAAVFTGVGIEGQDDPFAQMVPPAGGDTFDQTPPVTDGTGQPVAPATPPAPQQLTPEVAAEIEQARQFMPLLRFIQSDPDLIALIDQKVSGATQPAKPVVVEKLVAPQKPANYNPQESVQNPESESWKYREAMEDYRTKSIEVLHQEIQRRDQIAQEQAKVQEAKEKQRQQLGAVIREAVSQHGLTREDVPDFVQVMSNPKNVTTANMVQLYHIIKGGTAVRRPARPGGPLPGGGGSGGGTPIVDVNMNNAFNTAIRSWSK
jgi:hypothetical protein